MKTRILFLLFLIAACHFYSPAQNNVGIGTTIPDASAVLDITSNSKGLLVPRLTVAQRTALASPAKGLLVYQTEAPEGFYYNAGTPAASNWILLGATGPQGPQGLPGPVGATGAIKGYSTAGTTPFPSSVLSFIAPILSITLQQGQKVFMISTRALGGYAAANELGIYPAYQSTAPFSPIVTQGLGMFGLQVAAGNRINFTVHGVFENLPAGTYKFAMAGVTSSPNWTNSEWGYTTALVY